MIPVLFPSNATTFTTQGLGALSDAISCTVEEERNGIYEMALEYPTNGIHFSDIALRSIITAIPSPHRTAQPFRVYKIGKAMEGVCTIYAQHISYDLSGMPVKPCSGATNVLSAMNLLKNNSLVTCPFTMWTDKAVTNTYSVTRPASVKALLGGTEGSILDVFGTGEYEFDGYTVKLHLNRGSNRGFVINYGKNLTSLEQEENIANTVTGIYPYWYNEEDGTVVQLDSPIVNCPGTFTYTKVAPVDFSVEWEEAPTQAQLLARAEAYISDNKLGYPKVSLSLGFNEIGSLEQCDLCDTVTVKFEELGIDETAEIIRIKTNVLLEQYDNIEVGEPTTTLADIVLEQSDDVSTLTDSTSALGKSKVGNNKVIMAINDSTETVTISASKINLTGYLTVTAGDSRYDASGAAATAQSNAISTASADATAKANSAQSTAISTASSDATSKANAVKNGLATQGYTTINGGNITTGTMSANRISGGTLTLGGADNGNGELYVNNSSSTTIGVWNNDGIVINDDSSNIQLTNPKFKIRRLSGGTTNYVRAGAAQQTNGGVSGVLACYGAPYESTASGYTRMLPGSVTLNDGTNTYTVNAQGTKCVWSNASGATSGSWSEFDKYSMYLFIGRVTADEPFVQFMVPRALFANTTTATSGTQFQMADDGKYSSYYLYYNGTTGYFSRKGGQSVGIFYVYGIQ